MLFVHDFGKTKKRRLLESKPPFFQNQRAAATTSDDILKTLGQGGHFQVIHLWTAVQWSTVAGKNRITEPF